VHAGVFADWFEPLMRERTLVILLAATSSDADTFFAAHPVPGEEKRGN
jgi:hypothetical protein